MKKVKVTTMDELTPLIGKKVIVRDKQIGVFLIEDGQVHATNNVYPHKEGLPPESTVSGECIYCPLHDRKIDLNTGKMQRPDTGCVETYQVEIQNGDVLICL